MPTTTWRDRWLRKRRIIAVLCCLAALWLAWQVYDIVTGKPSPKVDYATPFYELIEGARERVGENAFETLSEVFRRARDAEHQLSEGLDPLTMDKADYDAQPSFSNMLDGPFRPQRWAKQIEAIERLRADSTFALAARLPTLTWSAAPRVTTTPFFDEYMNERTGTIGEIRTFCKLQGARMRLAAHAGDWDEFVAAFDESMAAIRLVSYEPVFIDSLVAVACHAMILHQLRCAFVEYSVPEDAALALRNALDRGMRLPPPEFVLTGEMYFQLDMLQHQYTASGRLPVSAFRMYADDWRTGVGTALAIAIPGHETAQRLTRESFEEMKRISNLSVAEIVALEQSGWSVPLPISQVAISGPDSTIPKIWARREAEFAASRLMLSIEAFIAGRGEAPASLAELAPELLDAPPVDPANGKPYGYRRITADAHGREYLLWSFGPDGEDNGGHEEPMKRWYDPKDAGVDDVINKPRAADP